jgi:uncharacterized protein YbjT (DUF2867 family)
MILVTTPTGDIGGRVLRLLLAAGASTRVIVRDAGKLPEDIRGSVDIIEGSHGNAATLAMAMEGIERVFWLPPGDPTAPSAHEAYVEFSRPFADALPRSNITHVVGVSALGRGWPKPAGLVSESLAMDDLISAAGVAYRALACASLMDNLMRQVEPIRSGVFHAPTPGDLALPHVAKADVAAIAARLLLTGDWKGTEEISLHGPEDLSFDQMAETLTAVLGRPVAFCEMSMTAFGAMLRSMGTSEGMVRAYVDMMTAKNAGMDKMHPAASRRDTPTTFRDWVAGELLPVILG